ncbi:LmeA family phospholipid-binding protein [Corynebacterium anserum]|uniref:LmeA family phospholipid-binding protein n=1 Tax=Corynebacterium anserum TaxID=2684406 RepID=UPI00163FBBF6|nr:DUF2993 domain-containing protein [Corynebacterium anserum]
MSNPQYNETSEYNFPSHGSGAHSASSGAQDWGHVSTAQKKRRGKALPLFLIIVLVLVVFLGCAEFGARLYAKNQLIEGIRQSASESGYELTQDPSVHFGASPLLLALLTKKVGSVDIDIPSSLSVSYDDGNVSLPHVKGAPEMDIEARSIALGEQQQDTSFGELTLHTSIPSELMLAEIVEEQQKHTGGNGVEDFLTSQIKVTGITPNEGNQELEFDINNGLAKLHMQPVVNDGQISFDVKSAQVLGILNLPDSAVQGIQEMLNRQQAARLNGNLRFEDVRVTDKGLDVRLHGTDVNVQELSSDLNKTTGSVAS